MKIIALDIHGEQWVFLFADAAMGRLYDVLGQYAAAPDLSFTWADAATVIDRAHALTATEPLRRFAA